MKTNKPDTHNQELEEKIEELLLEYDQGGFTNSEVPKWVELISSEVAKEKREIKEMLKIIKGYAEKFVNKVETGRARSRETYADMKHVLQLLESELKEDTND